MNESIKVQVSLANFAAMKTQDWVEINANEDARRREEFRQRVSQQQQRQEQAARAFLKLFFFQQS